MSDANYSGPLNDWMAQAPAAPPPQSWGKSLAGLLAPYLGIQPANDQAAPRPMTMAQPDVIGNRPDVQQAVKAAGAAAVEPFGQLGRVMTGTSQDTLGDIVGAAAGLAPIGPPGAGKALKAGAEAVESSLAKGATGGLTDFIKAYHGSPHDFDRFDLSKIGSGEGAQAYGHGLYFAESEDVAKSYKDILKGANTDWNDPKQIAGHFLDQAGGDRSIAANTLEGFRNRMRTARAKNYSMDAMAEAKKTLESGGEVSAPKQGRMYQVAIKAPPEHFLDWDKPLSEQSPKVREALSRVVDQIEGPGVGEGVHKTSMGADEWLSKLESQVQRPGQGRLDRPAISKQLREAGIPGIKYLDQGSRGIADAEKAVKVWQKVVNERPNDKDALQALANAKAKAAVGGTRNYVVFDDKLIDILKKYGIAGIAALPAMNAFHFQKSDKSGS